MNAARIRSGRVALALVVVLFGGFVLLGRGAAAETVEVGNLAATVEAGFAPGLLDKARVTPGALSLSAQFATLDRSHLPALKELVWEFDRNTRLGVSGLPGCHPRPGSNPQDIEKECEPAIVGRGRARFQILFEESQDTYAESRLVVYNEGMPEGVPTLFAHAYITKPVPSAVNLKIRLEPVHSEGFRTAMVVTVPKIAGGSGSVTELSMRLKRRVVHHGDVDSFVSLRCLDGRIGTRAAATFSDGTRLQDGAVRPCTAR